MGFVVKPENREKVVGVINVDGSCRPQIIPCDKTQYSRLLQELKSITGLGVVLNTSFNIHGEPVVNTPDEAIATMQKAGSDYLAIGNYLVSKKH